MFILNDRLYYNDIIYIYIFINPLVFILWYFIGTLAMGKCQKLKKNLK